MKDMDRSFYPENFVVPTIEIVHDRAVQEIYRGCIRGCRFCQAGFIYRPVREKGIDTVAAADEELRKMASEDLAWKMVRSAFGLPPRKPTKKENELSALWVNEWQMSKEMLEAAYDACVDATAGVSFPYIAKVLEKWHASGYKTPAEIVKEAKADKKQGSAYDLDLFEKMLNSKD
jgi:DnaD/phage-associated family protein